MRDREKWEVVTGGAGFIGSHLAEELLRRGLRVRIVDDFSTGKPSNVPAGAEVIAGDVVEVAAEALQDAENVYHLAAMASVPRSVSEPLRSHRATVESTVAVLEAAERAGARSFVLASSSAVYGDVPGLPKREDQTPSPVSPYALGKWCSELYTSHWSAHRSMKTVSLRFFNVYGPRQDPDSPYAAVIPIFIRHLQKDDPVPIHGMGDQIRDFIFVTDVVRGLILAGKSPVSSGRTYNLAGGTPVTILSLLSTLGRVLGKVPLPTFLPPRSGDVRESWADISRAEQDFDFAPEVTLEEGLRATVEWFQRQTPLSVL